MTAIIDIDNTVAETQIAIIKYIKQRGIDITSIQGGELRGNHDEYFNSYVLDFIHSRSYNNTVLSIEPSPNTLNSIKILSEFCNIYFVSSRIENWHKATLDWLNQHNFTSYAQGVVLRNSAEPSINFKQRLFKELRADVIFEDSSEIIDTVDSSIEVFIIDQPWNQDIKNSAAIRATNFSEAVEIFASRYKYC